jgi:GDP-4-dehydro-6-deoxy-D-mannose reductase
LSKKVLVTGCSGFLALHLLDILGKEKEIVLYGITEEAGFRSSRLKVYQVDLRDRERVFETVREIRPDLVFHLAAIANVGFSWKHQKLTYEVNFIGSSNLLEAVNEWAPGCRILMMSTAELYGNAKTTPYNESDVGYSPKNPYALSKMAMEMAADLYRDARGLDIITLRSFNFAGPAQDRKFVASDFSYQIAEIEQGIRKPVIRVGNLSAVRDLSDVRDIARYLDVISRQGESGGVYNLCSGTTCSIREILDTLLSFSTHQIEVTVDKEKLRPVDVPVLRGDNGLIKRQFNLFPQYQIKQTLLDLLNDCRKRVRGQRTVDR